jgi:hypothetical protein
MHTAAMLASACCKRLLLWRMLLAHLVDLFVADGEVKGVAHADGCLNGRVSALQYVTEFERMATDDTFVIAEPHTSSPQVPCCSG